MGNSFHAAMNDIVTDDSARMSGRDFADARGGGVARRVRTRRTVRAAGVGGASAVAVGALAVGVTQAPWRALTAPGGSPEHVIAQGSPFECGFVMDTPVHTSTSVEIYRSGLTTASDAAQAAMSGAFTAQELTNVPFLQASNLADPGMTAGVTGDPVMASGSPGDTATGAGVVQVAGGVVVAKQNAHPPSTASSNSLGILGNNSMSLYVLDPVYFAMCPGVTSLDGATMYAVAGSVTFDDKAKLSALAYAWQPLTSP